jgi:hypothetical protein
VTVHDADPFARTNSNKSLNLSGLFSGSEAIAIAHLPHKSAHTRWLATMAASSGSRTTLVTLTTSLLGQGSGTAVVRSPAGGGAAGVAGSGQAGSGVGQSGASRTSSAKALTPVSPSLQRRLSESSASLPAMRVSSSAGDGVGAQSHLPRRGASDPSLEQWKDDSTTTTDSTRRAWPSDACETTLGQFVAPSPLPSFLHALLPTCCASLLSLFLTTLIDIKGGCEAQRVPHALSTIVWQFLQSHHVTHIVCTPTSTAQSCCCMIPAWLGALCAQSQSAHPPLWWRRSRSSQQTTH